MPDLPPLDLVLAQVQRDTAAGRFSDWGWSTVVDENTGEPVIDEDLFTRLHDAARIEAAFPVGNAGLLHVYGYWFSTVLTPYGYKRDRWVEGRLAVALGLPPMAFHLDFESGSSLLERVTASALPLLEHPPAAHCTADAPVGQLLTRVVVASDVDGRSAALVYGVDGGSGMQLVTSFPVSTPTEAVLSEFQGEPRLRWNAAPPPSS